MEERGGERDPERFVFWGPRQCRAVPVPRALGRPPGRLPRKPRGPWTADEVRGPERSPQTAGASRVALSPLLITARRLGQWRRREGGEKPPTPSHTHTSSSQPEFRDGATPGCWGGVEVGTVQSCPGPDPAATSEGWLPAWPGERDAAASPADHAEDLPPPEASTGLVSSVDGWGGGADVAGDADNVRLAFAAPGLAPRLPADFSAPQRCARGSLLCGPRPRSRGSP